MSLAKNAPLLLLAFACGAAVLVGMRDNALRPAEAETAAAHTAQPARAPTQAELYAAASVATPRSVTLEMERGHYWADAKVNNSQVRFLVDTGASVIALTRDDARRIGLNIRSHGETARMSTANGVIEVPVVTLKRVKVGNIEVANVQAVVIEEGLSTSLLGMSFLSKLKSWQTTQAGLVLKQ